MPRAEFDYTLPVRCARMGCGAGGGVKLRAAFGRSIPEHPIYVFLLPKGWTFAHPTRAFRTSWAVLCAACSFHRGLGPVEKKTERAPQRVRTVRDRAAPLAWVFGKGARSACPDCHHRSQAHVVKKRGEGLVVECRTKTCSPRCCRVLALLPEAGEVGA